jgi:hypothetical protein
MANSCEGLRGTNTCGRKSIFLITEKGNPERTYYSCADCIGRIIVEQDIDNAEVERLYD